MKIVFAVSMFTGLFLLGCSKNYDRSTLKRMLKSSDVEQIIEATNYISDNRDTSMVEDILAHTFDPRITHLSTYKGMSVYQIKMGVMKEITGISPPNRTTYIPDSVNINFYLKVSKEKGWINQKLELNSISKKQYETLKGIEK